jgi:hypothetical protein
MCLQGGYALTEGLQRFKDYLASSSTELVSAVSVAFEFLELQARHPTQFKAFAELMGHIVEASLRHPHCNREELLKVALDFASDMAIKSNGTFIPYSLAEGYRQVHMRVYAKVLGEAVEAAERLASSPPRRRAIKLRALKCMKLPYLTFDGEVRDPVEPPIQHVDAARGEDVQVGGGTTTLGSGQAVMLPLANEADERAEDATTKQEPQRSTAA